MQRTFASGGLEGHRQITRAIGSYEDPIEALAKLSASEKRTTFMVMLLLYDCLRILKYLAKNKPDDHFVVRADNLLIRPDGHVVLSDCYI